MTPARFKECLEVLGLKPGTLNRHLKLKKGTAGRWKRDKARIPNDVAQWLERGADLAAKGAEPER